MPEEWGYAEENRTEPVRGAALPMGFNRTPHYYRGLLLAGDAAGMVNPFNGEGIAYAMESGEILARVVAQALARPDPRTRPSGCSAATREALPGRLRPATTPSAGCSSQLIGRPQLMRYATRHGHATSPR